VASRDDLAELEDAARVADSLWRDGVARLARMRRLGLAGIERQHQAVQQACRDSLRLALQLATLKRTGVQ
jgi:hypothetical protein